MLICFNISLAKPHAKQIAYLSHGVLKQVQHDLEFKQKKAICITQIAFSLSKNYFLKYLKSLPMNLALAPNSSSIRNNWLYLAILSEREAEPVLI
jgi:hypothetical protein